MIPGREHRGARASAAGGSARGESSSTMGPAGSVPRVVALALHGSAALAAAAEASGVDRRERRRDLSFSAISMVSLKIGPGTLAPNT